MTLIFINKPRNCLCMECTQKMRLKIVLDFQIK
jgi:hypothetical protein